MVNNGWTFASSSSTTWSWSYFIIVGIPSQPAAAPLGRLRTTVAVLRIQDRFTFVFTCGTMSTSTNLSMTTKPSRCGEG
jgi:hypothetical protein